MGKQRRDAPDAPVSVNELNNRAKDMLEQGFPDVLVEGEVGRLTKHASGHVWFSLKDHEASIDAVCWASNWRMMPVRPEEGMRVVVRGQLTIFPRTGNFQVVVRKLRPAGEGSLRARFLEIKARLDQEGLTAQARKRHLPFLPRAVGIVTSETGAALQDILRSIHDRFPGMRCVYAPTIVQGPDAPRRITSALRRMAEVPEVDVIIVGRGGGSQEDLWAFNDERLARAIAACPVPVVSAVGHEIDHSISDFVADARALTPTHAGGVVVPDHLELVERLDGLRARLAQAARRLGRDERRRLDDLGRRVGRRRFVKLIEEKRQELDWLAGRLARGLGSGVIRQRAELVRLGDRMTGGVEGIVARARHEMKPIGAALRALNPLAVLSRGFSVTRVERDGEARIVRGPEEVRPGDRLLTAFASGDEVASDVRESVKRGLPEA